MSLRGRAGLARRWPAAAISRTSPVGGCMRPGCHTRTTASAPTPSGLVSVCRWGQPARPERNTISSAAVSWARAGDPFGTRSRRRADRRRVAPVRSRESVWRYRFCQVPPAGGARRRGPVPRGASPLRQRPRARRLRGRGCRSPAEGVHAPLAPGDEPLTTRLALLIGGGTPRHPPLMGAPAPHTPWRGHRKKRGAPTRWPGFKRPGPHAVARVRRPGPPRGGSG
jgi:hypothetical protein